MKLQKLILGVSVSVIFLVISSLILVQFTPVLAQGGETDFLESCPTDSINPDCNPPTLQQLEYIFVRVIYFVWAFSGLIFLALLLRIAYVITVENISEDKMGEMKQLGGRWLIGLLMVFLSRPLVGTAMHELVADNANCYGNLRDPGFTFFFADACTEGVTASRIYGKITDSSGNIVSSARIVFFKDDAGTAVRVGETQSDSGGLYSFTNVSTDESYSVVVCKEISGVSYVGRTAGLIVPPHELNLVMSAGVCPL